jgi:hypothetical protein
VHLRGAGKRNATDRCGHVRDENLASTDLSSFGRLTDDLDDLIGHEFAQAGAASLHAFAETPA